MQPLQYLLLAGMVIFAIYRQTRVSEAGGPNRYKLAIIYGGIGLASLFVTGWELPQGIGWLFLGAGIALSVIVGVLRGILTRVWVAADGRRYRQGTWLTVSLFIAVIVAKIVLGAVAVVNGVADGSSFAEILIIVAIMIAVQAEIVYRRALALEALESVESVESEKSQEHSQPQSQPRTQTDAPAPTDHRSAASA